MSQREDNDRTPDLLVEKLALGELDEAEAARVRARLEAEEGGLERLSAIEQDNAEVLEAYPAARAAKDIEDRARVADAAERERARRRGTPRWLVVAPTAVAAALLLVVVATGDGPTPVEAPSSGDGVRTKGLAPHLVIHRQRDDEASRLNSGDLVRAGERLQLAYVASGAPFGAIFSVDGRGVVTQHLPRTGGVAARLQGEGTTTLPTSYELDDAPEFERFFFFTSEGAFELAAVKASLEPLGASRGSPSLPTGVTAHELLVEKAGAAAEDR
jgi:hypothetical protein